MPLKSDLHIHTTCSDGKMDPIEVINLAMKRNLSSVAITDHDTLTGYEKAKSFAEENNVDLVPGVEVTTTFNGKETHVLAYYFDTDTNYFAEFLQEQRNSRTDRLKRIVNTLKKQNIDVTYDEIWAEANGANLGRPHIAQKLIDKGYVSSFNQAFKLYLSDEKLGGIENNYPKTEDAINMIKNVGGAAIIAHPGRLFSTEQIHTFIEMGIDGVECIHPSHNWKKQLELIEYCEQNNLLKTGGSDYHGTYERASSKVGIIGIAQKNVDAMKRMTDQRKLTTLLKN